MYFLGNFIDTLDKIGEYDIKEKNKESRGIPMNINMSPAKDLDYYIGQKDFVIIDLRRKEEYEESHILSAVNIPYEEWEEQFPNLDYKKQYILYCERGGSSLLAAKELLKNGYRILSVIGGFQAYRGNKKTGNL